MITKIFKQFKLKRKLKKMLKEAGFFEKKPIIITEEDRLKNEERRKERFERIKLQREINAAKEVEQYELFARIGEYEENIKEKIKTLIAGKELKEITQEEWIELKGLIITNELTNERRIQMMHTQLINKEMRIAQLEVKLKEFLTVKFNEKGEVIK